ncbi:MAG: type II 3-dehydroquinate dehydratase, partial [Rhodoferax sp.]|nr:type II 3-dehydroquinate dehydratase [Rhodoferax sp.]
MKILMLHGINHNMFGKRDPVQYGTITLDEINASLVALGKELGAEIEAFQTNHEGEMCERVHQAFVDGVDAVLVNAGAKKDAAVADAGFNHAIVCVELKKGDYLLMD